MSVYFLSAVAAFFAVLILGPVVLPLLHRMKFGQIEREEGPASHKKKQGTPTMGGIMFLVAIFLFGLLFGSDGAPMVLPALVIMLLFGLVGFLDDFLKIRRHHNLGLRVWQKIVFQLVFSFLIAFWAYRSPLIGSALVLPVSGKTFDLGVWYIPAVMFVIIAEVNAVNLTDGLDGLASGVTLIYAVAAAVIFSVLASGAILTGDVLLSDGYRGMTVLCAVTAGALSGFLVYNSYPARVFMGDTGSLALGGLVSAFAIFSRSVILLPLMGICFLASALSVVLQVGSYKLRHGKRIFRMAPLHHHFELCGMHESKIVSMYAIVTAVCCAAGLWLWFLPKT